ncbi:restriction endonuclease subunit S [Levyella massiliensis]|uniref:restriction endonuclease subunit S n=1 Tax=Levyella massiliensis TaxID=938289 RepID=UPI000371344B|nr:restriction endonuclease subunit S [Levyella massiliensis]
MLEYPEYSPTGIVWAKSMPAHWKCDKAKRFFLNPKVINKGNVEKNVMSLTLRGVIRNDINNPIGLAPADYSTYQIFESNELVFKLIDLENISTSRVGIVPERGIMSSAYIRLKPMGDLNITYFYYQYFDWYKRNIFNGLGAGVRQTLSASDLLDLNIMCPPRNEQDKIVRFLDWKVSQFTKFIREKKAEIKLLQEYKTALINSYITGGVKSDTDTIDSGVDWIGEIPSSWSIDTIKQHFTVKKRIAGKEGYDVLSITQQGLKVKDITKNEGQMANSYANYQFVYPGEFAMNHMDLITGFVDLSDKFGVTSPDYRVFAMFDDKNCYDRYYLRVFQICYKRRVFYKFGKGAAHQGRWRLPKDRFLQFQIPVPSYKEQVEIAKKCDDIERVIDEAITGIKTEIDLIEELRMRTISDVVTGKVYVRDVEIPAYEAESSDIDDDILEDDDSEEVDTVDEEVDE